MDKSHEADMQQADGVLDSTEKRRLSLPDLCQDCPARPSMAGGNGLCGKFNGMLDDLVVVRDIFSERGPSSATLGSAATAIAWKLDGKDSLPTTPARSNGVSFEVRNAAANAFSSVFEMLAAGDFISNEFEGPNGEERQTAPADSGVDFCIRPLIDLTDPQRVEEVYPLLNVARSILDARNAGVNI